MTMEVVGKTSKKHSAVRQAGQGQSTRLSNNNMSRRRNRANASLPDTADLEEKSHMQQQQENEDEN